MKKFFAIFLACVMLFSMTACNAPTPGEQNPDATSNTNDDNYHEDWHDETEPTEAETVAKYDSYKYGLSLVEDYEEFYGKTDAFLLYGYGSEAIYSDGVIYETAYGDGWEAYWRKWNIGKDVDIVLFDGAIAVVEDKDGTLTAYGVESEDEETAEMNLQPVVLEGIDRTEFIWAFHPIVSSVVACIYRENGVIYYQQFDALSKEVGEKLELAGYIEDYDDAQSIDKYFAKTIGAMVVIDDTCYGNYSMDVSFSFPNGTTRAFMGLRDTDKLENVDSFFADASDYMWVSHCDDNNTLYGYAANSLSDIWDNPDLGWYKEPIKITLPDGHSTEDIVDFAAGYKLYIRFGDNTVYTAYTSDLENTTQEDVFRRLDDLDECEVHIRDIYLDEHNVFVLMDDGCLYEAD